MYKKILAAVNEHLNSEVSARYALHLAKTVEGRMYIHYVAETGVSERTFKLAEEAVMRLFKKGREMGVDIESVLDSGDPLEKIRNLVKTEGIDIVFASTRKEDVEKRFYTGTLAKRLSVNLPCSVALVRVVHMGRIHPGKILVPLKARVDHIQERSYFSSMFASAFGSKIHVFHATNPIIKFFHGEVHLTPVEWEKKLPRDISLFIESLKRYDVTHEKKLVPGKAEKNIAIEAAAKRFDLIIMGASERTLLSSIFKGNPVERVLRETPCDLIILKARHEDQ